MDKDKEETKLKNDDENVEEGKKKINVFKLLIIIGSVILTLAILFLIFKSSIIVSKNDLTMNDENVNYLTSKYGENVDISFVSKKKKKKYSIWEYNVCSKTTGFCVKAKYSDKHKDWTFINGEGFMYALLFLDQSIDILNKNNISYKTYGNNKTPFDMADRFILVLKKDDDGALINAIKEMDGSSFINSLCTYNTDSSTDCTGEIEIDIFNNEDYDLITKEVSNSYGISGYRDLYKVILEHDENKYDSKLGTNIERHPIGDNMFTCVNDDCTTYKHLAYRYVIGDHNQFKNTIIIEGL